MTQVTTFSVAALGLTICQAPALGDFAKVENYLSGTQAQSRAANLRGPMMDRAPLPAPFPKGTKLRCLAPTRSWTVTEDGTKVPIRGPGFECIVSETRPGYRGTLRHVRDEDGPMYYEDTGEPIRDETKDGYSVYEVTDPKTGKKLYGRCIDPERACEWEVIG